VKAGNQQRQIAAIRRRLEPCARRGHQIDTAGFMSGVTRQIGRWRQAFTQIVQ
jgi:hypothetical protein